MIAAIKLIIPEKEFRVGNLILVQVKIEKPTLAKKKIIIAIFQTKKVFKD